MTLKQKWFVGMFSILMFAGVPAIIIVASLHRTVPTEVVNQEQSTTPVKDPPLMQDTVVPTNPEIPPVGPAWVTSLGTGGIGVLA